MAEVLQQFCPIQHFFPLCSLSRSFPQGWGTSKQYSPLENWRHWIALYNKWKMVEYVAEGFKIILSVKLLEVNGHTNGRITTNFDLK